MVISEWIYVRCCYLFSSLFYHRTYRLLNSVKCFAGYLPSQLLFYRQDNFEGFIGFHPVAGAMWNVRGNVSKCESRAERASYCFQFNFNLCRVLMLSTAIQEFAPLPGRREMFGENSTVSKRKPVVQRHRFLLNLSCLENKWINLLKPIWIATSSRKKWLLVLLNEGFSY